MRPARREDAPHIARILMDGLGDKLRPIFGRRAEAALAVVARRDLDRPSRAYLVATLSDRPVGVAHLAVAHEPDPGLLGALRREVGWLCALRAGCVLALIGHGGLGPAQAYLQEMAVASTARRRGAGRALLRACAREARARGCTETLLWVVEGNAAAIGLYTGEGFVPLYRRRWLMGRLLLRAPRMLLMRRDEGAAAGADRKTRPGGPPCVS